MTMVLPPISCVILESEIFGSPVPSQTDVRIQEKAPFLAVLLIACLPLNGHLAPSLARVSLSMRCIE